MIKKSVFVFVCLLSFIPLQSNAQVGFVLGLKGGYNVSNLSKNIGGDFDSKSSGAGGLFASIILSKAFAIQPEFMLRRGGATQTSNSYYTSVTLNYFQIPLLFKLRLPVAGVLFPHVFAGPTFDYVASSSFDKMQNSSGGTTIQLNAGPFKKVGGGGLAGIGVDVQISRLFLTADVRYGFGFNDISTDFLAVKANYYMVMAGIGINLGSK